MKKKKKVLVILQLHRCYVSKIIMYMFVWLMGKKWKIAPLYIMGPPFINFRAICNPQPLLHTFRLLIFGQNKNRNKHNAELQRADPGTKVTG